MLRRGQPSMQSRNAPQRVRAWIERAKRGARGETASDRPSRLSRERGSRWGVARSVGARPARLRNVAGTRRPPISAMSRAKERA